MRTRFRSLVAFLRCSRKTLLLIVIVAVTSIALSTMVSMLISSVHNFTIPSLGTIKTIGVESYWDPDCTNKTEVIDWDIIWFGTSTNVTLYIRSVSNYPITLTLNATDWVPEKLSDYMSLSWDYDGTLLDPDETTKVILSLKTSVSYSFIQYLINNNVQNFTVDIYIIASEV